MTVLVNALRIGKACIHPSNPRYLSAKNGIINILILNG
jgi:hypothetical protein